MRQNDPMSGHAQKRTEGVHRLDRWAWATGIGLFALALAVRLRGAELLEISSDSADPLRGALAIVEGRRGLLDSSLPFGWGREFTYLPLLLARGGGLLAIAWLRALAQSLCVLLVFLAAKGRGGRGATLAVLVSMLLALSPALLRTLASGHEGYFAPEWVMVAAALLSSRRPQVAVPALGGAALALAVANHPMALTAVPGALLLRGTWSRRDALAALAGFGLIVLPTALLAAPPLVHGLLGEWRALAPHGEISVLAATKRIFGGEIGWESWGWIAALLLAAIGADTTERRGLCLGLFAGLALGVLLATATGHASPWHWRPLLPLFALAVAGADVRGALRVASLLVLLVLVAVTGQRAWSRIEQQPEQIAQVGVIRLLARELGDEGPHALAGYLDMPPGPPSDFLGVGLELALRGRGRDLIVDRDAMLDAPTIVYAEGEGDFVGRLAAALTGSSFAVRARSGRFLLAEADGAGSARKLGGMICTLGSNPVRRLMMWDALSLVAEKHLWRTDSVPAQHPCSLDDPWVPIDPPSHPEAFRERLARIGDAPTDEAFDAFSITRFEATWSDLRACSSGGGCPGTDTSDPVLLGLPALVSSEVAAAYCAWLGGRLPTLLEWRLAGARWSQERRGYQQYPWGDEPGAARARSSAGTLVEPGQFPEGASPDGVEDLLGNAAEWVLAGTRERCGELQVIEVRPVLAGGSFAEPLPPPEESPCREASGMTGGIRCVR